MNSWLREWQWYTCKRYLAGLELLVFDVDGVLTDGGLLFSTDGEVVKRFDVRDGLGMRLLQNAGIEVAFLSGGQGGATQERAKQLGITYCLVGIEDKASALLLLQEILQVPSEATAFVGDDLNDLPVRQHVGLFLAPSDACKLVRARADAVLNSKGGQSAARELAERILKARGQFDYLKRNGWHHRNDLDTYHGSDS